MIIPVQQIESQFAKSSRMLINCTVWRISDIFGRLGHFSFQFTINAIINTRSKLWGELPNFSLGPNDIFISKFLLAFGRCEGHGLHDSVLLTCTALLFGKYPSLLGSLLEPLICQQELSWRQSNFLFFFFYFYLTTQGPNRNFRLGMMCVF